MTHRSKLLLVLLVGACLLVLPVVDASASARPHASSKAHSVSTTTATSVTAAVGSAPKAHALLAPPACPTGYACGTVPTTCPSGSTCPAYQVGPVSNLGASQWVYVNLYDWSSTPGIGDWAQINYCSDVVPLSSNDCVNSGGQGVAETDYQTQAFPDGNTEVSFQVAEVDQTAVALNGATPGNSDDTGSFYCNATAPCSIDITDTGPSNSGSLALDPSTTAVIPVTFQPPNGGCPTANTVNTQSEFGVDILFPVAARISCTGANPTIAFNTAIDGLTAVTSLQQNEVDVAFSDDPEQADQQSELKMGNFALIPVALSANVISFIAEQRIPSPQELVPLDNMDLTPRMVAGLVTGYYEDIGTADVVPCQSSGCVIPPCPQSVKKNKPTTSCSLMNELNYNSAFLFTQIFGGYDRSDTSGPTGQLFDWLCDAPALPVQAVGATFTEPSSAASVLEAGLNPTGKPLKTCPTGEQFPPVRSGLTDYNAYDDPSQQALKINSAVNPTEQQPIPYGGFASMDWADAEYYGMSVAALQNAAGDFVLPTQQSLDAAVADATVNPDGSLTPNYQSTDPNAYPMPSITYAVVPTRGVTASQVAADQAMLTQLLSLTGGADTGNLPAGFVPLPSSLYQKALADVQSDFANENAPVPTTTTTTTSSASSSSSGTAHQGSAPAAGATTPASAAHTSTATAPHASTASAGASTVATTTTTASPGSSRHGQSLGSLSLVASNSGNLIPVSVLLGVLAVALGCVLFLSPGLRRHLFDLGHAASLRVRRVTAKAVAGLKKVPAWLGAARAGPGPV